MYDGNHLLSSMTPIKLGVIIPETVGLLATPKSLHLGLIEIAHKQIISHQPPRVNPTTMSYLAVAFSVASLTKPHNFKWLVIILVVHLGSPPATPLTRLLYKLTLTQGSMSILSRLVLPEASLSSGFGGFHRDSYTLGSSLPSAAHT